MVEEDNAGGCMGDDTRAGARQTERFNPARAARLDDPARFAYLEPEAVVKLLDLGRDARVVDFGAGTGAYAVEIARARPDVRVFAFDDQAAMLERMAAKLAAASVTNVEPIGPQRADVLRGAADRVLALNVLHELGDAALAQLTSFIKPGGFAVFIDWNADVERPHGPSHERVYGVAEARQRLESNHFSIRSLTRFSYHYAFTAEPAMALGIARDTGAG